MAAGSQCNWHSTLRQMSADGLAAGNTAMVREMALAAAELNLRNLAARLFSNLLERAQASDERGTFGFQLGVTQFHGAEHRQAITSLEFALAVAGHGRTADSLAVAS